MHIYYIYIYITEAMNLKDRKKTYMGGAGGRNGKGEVV